MSAKQFGELSLLINLSTISIDEEQRIAKEGRSIVREAAESYEKLQETVRCCKNHQRSYNNLQEITRMVRNIENARSIIKKVTRSYKKLQKSLKKL